MAAVHLEVFGKVQGVGFRAFTQRAARRRSVRGWVRNRQDGSVEALLIGDDSDVAAVVENCRRGPATARVDRLEQTPAADDGSPGFVARPTV
jgi:acylphosphatase